MVQNPVLKKFTSYTVVNPALNICPFYPEFILIVNVHRFVKKNITTLHILYIVTSIEITEFHYLWKKSSEESYSYPLQY